MRWLPSKQFLITSSSALLALGVVARQLASIGAGLILHPPRRTLVDGPPPTCREVTFAGAGVVLRGWHARASGERRGTVIYLHGVADNRASGAGVIERFRRRGFDVVAYDSRAHGESSGEATTYGYYEKADLQRVLDILPEGPVVLVGSSLGAAVALQAAGEDRRVSAVIAAEAFSDLQTVVRERAPFFFSAGAVAAAIRQAEERGRFSVEAVSPMASARQITVPVLIVHGAADTDTSPDHSRRVYDALDGPKRFILVPGVGHGESLQGAVWEDIEHWLEAQVQSWKMARSAVTSV
jgi:pimeloyl-ACP methyl ester carboxylesterase